MNENLDLRTAARCGASVYSTANQTIATDVPVAIEFDAVSYNPVGMWNSIAPTKLFAPIAGYYIATGVTTWDIQLAGSYFINFIQINATTPFAISNHVRSATTQIAIPCTGMTYLAAGDYVELYASHDVGIDCDVITAGLYGMNLSLHRLP